MNQPMKVCAPCGQSFYTEVGLDEHMQTGHHSTYARRWTTGRVSPAGLVALQEAGRQVAALNNARRPGATSAA